MDAELHPDIESLSPEDWKHTMDTLHGVVDAAGSSTATIMAGIDKATPSTNIEDRRGEGKDQSRVPGKGGKLPFAGGDSIAPMADNPGAPGSLTGAFKALGSTIAPNLTSIASGASPEPLGALPEQGKVSSTEDPRVNQAIGEVGMIGAAILPMIAGAPGAISLGEHIVSKASNIAAGAAGLAAAASATPANAAKLNRQQQQELLLKRETLKAESQAAIERAREMNLQELDLRRQGLQAEAEAKQKDAEMQLRISQEKQLSEVQLQREEEARKANAPFREKYPNLSTALSNTGLALAAMLPYGTRMYQASKATPFIRAWENTAKEAETALKTKEMDHARILVDQLVGYKKEAIKLDKAGGPSNAVINTLSATTPLETQMLPELMDLSFGNQDAKDRAKNILLDPMRLPASIGQGIVGAGIGAKAPLLNETPSKSTVNAQTEGLIKSFKTISRRKVK